MKRSFIAAALLLAPLAAAAADDSSQIASDLVQLAALFEGTVTTPIEKLVLAAPESCPTRFAVAALRYRANRDPHRNAFFEQLVIDDYAERAKGRYNVVSAGDVRAAVGAALAGYSTVAERLQPIVAFCSLQEKNLWVSTQQGRISIARMMRGAALYAVLADTDENPLEIANAVDARAASRHAGNAD